MDNHDLVIGLNAFNKMVNLSHNKVKSWASAKLEMNASINGWDVHKIDFIVPKAQNFQINSHALWGSS